MKFQFPLLGLFLSLLLLGQLSAQSSIPIRTTAFFPDSVLATTSAQLPDGRVIVWGGQKLTQTPSGKIWLSNKSYIYDYVNESWSEGPDLGAEVAGALTLTMANGNILSIGGQSYVTIATIDSVPQRTDRVEMLDVNTLTWTAIDSLPFGSSPYTGTSGILLPDSNIWVTTTNGDYGTLDKNSLTWTNQSGIFGPLDAGGRNIVILDNGIVFHTGAGGQYYDIANQMITYADPVVPMHPENVVKLNDGRILTWDDGFSFSQQALMVNASGLGSSITDSLVIPGQSTQGVLMPSGKVWVFGLGEIGIQQLTLLQIFDPVTDTWSSPGTYGFRPDVPTGYHMHLLPDSSILIASTRTSYRINAGPATSVQPSPRLDWQIIHPQGQRLLKILPGKEYSSEEVEFLLMDMGGRIVMEQQLHSPTHLDLNHLPKGIYNCLLLGSKGTQITRKILLD